MRQRSVENDVGILPLMALCARNLSALGTRNIVQFTPGGFTERTKMILMMNVLLKEFLLYRINIL